MWHVTDVWWWWLLLLRQLWTSFRRHANVDDIARLSCGSQVKIVLEVLKIFDAVLHLSPLGPNAVDPTSPTGSHHSLLLGRIVVGSIILPRVTISSATSVVGTASSATRSVIIMMVAMAG